MKILKIINHFLSLVFLIALIYISFSNLHLKTLYQTFFNLILLSIFCYFIFKFKLREEFKFNFGFYFWQIYWIIVAAYINSLAESYYKLGRYYFDLDFFRFLPSLIPLYFYFNYISFLQNKNRFFSFHVYSVIVLTSISYSFLYSEISEVSLLFFYPFFVEYLGKTSGYNLKNISLVFLSFCLLFLFSLLFGFSSQYFLTYLFLFFLLFGIYSHTAYLNYKFIIVLLFLNGIEVVLRSYYLNESFILLSKDGSSILNSNRVSAYIAIHIPLVLFLFESNISKFFKSCLVLTVLFGTIILLNQVSRASIFGLAIVIFTYLLYKIFSRKWFFCFLFFIFLFIMLLHFMPLISVWIGPGSYSQYDFLNQVSSGRWELWRIFYQIFTQLSVKEKVFGLGIGEHNFLLAYLPANVSPLLEDFTTKADGAYLHTHNLPSTILFYSGLVGLVFYLVFLGILLKKITKSILIEKRWIYPLLALIYFLIHNSFDMLIDVYGFMVIFIYQLNGNFTKNESEFQSSEPKAIETISRYLFLILLLLGFYAYFLYSRLIYKHDYFVNNNIINQNFNKEKECNLVRFPGSDHLVKNSDFQYNSENLIFKDFPSYRYSQEMFLFQMDSLNQTGNLSNRNVSFNQIFIECKKHHFRPILCEMNYPNSELDLSGKWLSQVSKNCKLPY
ncbi:hypothetical protein EHQ43_14205 [Leptospira bouyouniensis]|uniref:O-antigen ligase-related domain-containing protein n=1 Tax=Leptospira bouyouniensis TaxID=2484911 RepID=A0A7I0HQM8_9LEPT|nr:hypothetical protein EHQ43_14205 [Leptospira bouyouniensis]